MNESSNSLDHTAPTAEFTPEDNAFFEAGEKLAEESFDTFEDLDDGYERPSFWERLKRGS